LINTKQRSSPSQTKPYNGGAMVLFSQNTTPPSNPGDPNELPVGAQRSIIGLERWKLDNVRLAGNPGIYLLPVQFLLAQNTRKSAGLDERRKLCSSRSNKISLVTFTNLKRGGHQCGGRRPVDKNNQPWTATNIS